MQTYSVQNLAEFLNAQIIGNPNMEIDKVWTDSRAIVNSGNGIFIALKGAQIDGHQFIQQSFDKGIRSFLVQDFNEKYPKNATYLLVENSLKALQNWAKFHREKFDFPMVGITGSNGKTIVKEWLHHLLFPQKHIVRSPKSYNSQLGVPLSLLEMNDSHDLGIFEVGISQPNEMQILANLVQPNIGVLTNVGSAHSAFFESRNQHIFEKSLLFQNCEKIVLSTDDEQVVDEIKENYQTEIITWGKSENADFQILNFDSEKKLIEILNQKTSEKFELNIPFSTEADVQNAVCCLVICSALGIDLQTIIERFSTLLPVEMRLETKDGLHNSLIINDSFNSDLSSIPIALNLLNQQKNEHKTLILTDVLQNKSKENSVYDDVAHWVNAFPIQKIILIGNEIANHGEKFNHFHSSFSSVNEFLQNFKASDFSNEAVLLKGARIYGLEKISRWLEEKSHATLLEVNLQSLIENVNYFRQKINPKTKLMCMVKAFAYGTGGFEVAKILERHHVDYLGVAYPDEGMQLREAGIKMPIMVMNPEQNSYATIIEYNLEPEIYSFRVLELFSQTIAESGKSEPYPIHIKVDTGMHRLGFQPEDVEKLGKIISENPYVKVASVFSHLAKSDEKGENSFTKIQYEQFNEMYDLFVQNLNYSPPRHLLNSDGILNFPEFQMEMVRLGIGMYGISSDKNATTKLKNVATFKTVISQIRWLEKGEGVSYGLQFIADKKTRIATLPVGYADGVKRLLSNGKGEVLINQKRAKILGVICMDMLMVDVTEIDCNEGDEVIIFGENPSLESFAKWCDTISYEILTSISSRVKRVYVQE